GPKRAEYGSAQAEADTLALPTMIHEAFFGGARGGGKSDGMLGDLLDHQERYGAHAVGVFLRRRKRRLERSAREVADALLDFLNNGTGQCDPLKEQLAAKANVSEKTVERRLDDLRRLGLLRWRRRIERRGWRAEQISNAYVLCPDGPEPPPLPRASFQ